MSEIVLITGATSGFGKAAAEIFASKGYQVIITGRRKERLEAFKNELDKKYPQKTKLLAFDVQNKKEVFDAIENLEEDWKKISILINNAGLALGRDFFDDANLEDWETMMNTNVNGLLYVSKAVLPFMIKNKKGHIINIGSTAGIEVYEKGNAYCASKFAVNAISQAMRIDLLRHKIKVTCINPGAADTEFSKVRFKGDEQQAAKVYEGYQAMSAEDVAGVIYYCTTLPNHLCINELTLTCTAQANSFYLYKDL